MAWISTAAVVRPSWERPPISDRRPTDLFALSSAESDLCLFYQSNPFELLTAGRDGALETRDGVWMDAGGDGVDLRANATNGGAKTGWHRTTHRSDEGATLLHSANNGSSTHASVTRMQSECGLVPGIRA